VERVGRGRPGPDLVAGRTAIAGIGQTVYGKNLGRTELELACDAIVAACADAGFPVPDRYNFTDYLPAVGPVKVSLKVEARPKSVLWMPEGRPLKWAWRDGRLETEIPSLEVHGILLVE